MGREPQIRTRASILTMMLLACVAPVYAQSVKEGRTAFENLRGSRSREQLPGAMVRAGLVRALDTANQARAQVVAPQITETSHPTEPRTQFLVTAIETVFDQLGRTLLFLGNRLAARAGLTPLLPADVFFSSTGATGGDLSNLLDLLTGGSAQADANSSTGS